MWVGEDDEGIGAVLVMEADSANFADVFVKAGAIARRHRGTGGGVADEMFEFCFDEITSRAVSYGTTETLVSCRIDPSNSHSQEAARRNGLRHVDTQNDFQLWQVVLEYPAELLQLALTELEP